MADINSVVLVGRLVRDAELKYTSGGMAICEFSIAVNNRRKQGDDWIDEPNFFDVTLFGRRGEAIQQYLTKGKTLGVEGQLRQDRWQNQEGQNRSKVSIVAKDVMLIGGRGGSEASGSGGGSAGRDRGPAGSAGNSGGNSNGGGDDFPDDIPF